MLIALNKPYGRLSQFTKEPRSKWDSLADLGLPSGVYPIGRLDADSEGLLLLSDEAELNARLLRPERAHSKTYWVQVEGVPDEGALGRLRAGVEVDGRRTLPAAVSSLEAAPAIPPRHPPVRYRKSVPDSWIAIVLREGKNRQVRRMTAAVGHPTLRLWRESIGGLRLADLRLAPSEWLRLEGKERAAVFINACIENDSQSQ